jgi:hypothetical protein
MPSPKEIDALHLITHLIGEYPDPFGQRLNRTPLSPSRRQNLMSQFSGRNSHLFCALPNLSTLPSP